MTKLTAKQALFVTEYLVDLNATQAAIRSGYSAKTARSVGAENLTKPAVASAIAAAQTKRSEKVEITSAQVLERWWSIATADPNELIEYRRGCCRYCWGKDFRWQETPSEKAERAVKFAAEVKAARKAGEDVKELGDFGDLPLLGGLGWDPRRSPNADCPECVGEGQERAFPKDTRDLSPAARALYAGVKVTKEGIEIKMQSQEGALAKVAQHLGMLKERHEHSGPGGGPIETRDLVDDLATLTDADRAGLRKMAEKMEAARAAGKVVTS